MDYRRNLPHIHPDGAWLFITWRLHGALPATRGRSFSENDIALDRAASGNRWLADPRIADLVAAAIREGADQRCLHELAAWCIMPNHGHLLIPPMAPVPRIMQWLKGSTSRRANQLLGRLNQPFWQTESYDHYLRDARERHSVIAYIEHNPVASGLAPSILDWPWSSARAPRASTMWVRAP